MLFEFQKAPELGTLRRRGLALSAALHLLLFLFVVFNPDFFSTTPRRVVRVEGEDYERDRFEVVELYVPPDLAAPPPVVDPPAEVVVPAPEVAATPPPPPPEPPAPEEVVPPEPEPELPPIPPPPVIGPDDVIAEGARPDAPLEPSDAPPPAELQPPTAEAGGDGGVGDGGDGPQDPASPTDGTASAEASAELPENTNPNALVVPNLRRQAESLIEETVAQNPRSGSAAGGGDVLPNLTTDSPEILSDTRGYDFGPYMNQVINRVRTNWYSLIPEAARIGTLRGRVVIVFTITESGRIENLRAVGPSGSSPLDRAAVAAIQASNPFPDLPSDFSGDRLVLQFAFLYNLPRSSGL